MAASPQAPKPLKDWQVVLYSALLPVCAALFFVGLLGIFVLSGTFSDRQQRLFDVESHPIPILPVLGCVSHAFQGPCRPSTEILAEQNLGC